MLIVESDRIIFNIFFGVVVILVDFMIILKDKGKLKILDDLKEIEGIIISKLCVLEIF